MSSRRLVGLMAEPERRRVVAALILDAETVDEVAERAGVELRTAVDAIDRLVSAGLVEPLGDGRFHLLGESFKLAARSEADPTPESGFPDLPDEERPILDRAISEGRLIRMPSKWSHKLVVLNWLAQRFEPGVRYSERQVNSMLASVDDDVATLRRYLVDAGMLDRADGEYWRSGGRVSPNSDR